jgi:hypothetical protein
MPNKRKGALAQAAALAARAKAKKRPPAKPADSDDELILARKKRKLSRTERDEEDEDGEGEGEEEEEDADDVSSTSSEVGRRLDAADALKERRRAFREKEKEIEAVDKQLAEADARAAAKHNQLRNSRNDYPTDVAVSLFLISFVQAINARSDINVLHEGDVADSEVDDV